jgi:UDP-glucose 4-epimerase
MRILITGGSGFIGRNLVEGLSTPTSGYEVKAPISAELDLLDDGAVREYLRAERFDVIVHAATTRSNRRVTAPAEMLDRNCRMFFNLVRNRDAFGKMIHFGSGAEYGPRGLLPLKVREEFFDTHVPCDAYGFSKYICGKWIEGPSADRSVRPTLVELRLFAVFGPYEDYTVRFISNACCRALKGLPIVVRQDVLFDYMYVKDLAPIVRWFLENDARQGAYNVCSGKPVALTEIAKMVAEVSGKNPEIAVVRAGMGEAYTGDNARLMSEMGAYPFWDLQGAIADLYRWYEEHEAEIDGEALKFDER